MPAIRVLLVDDHHLFRAGIRSLLQTATDIEVVAEADNGRDALRLIEIHRPDVVLMDISMSGLNGLDATAQAVARFPRTRILILSMNAGEDSVLQSLRVGAVGYLVKTADPAELELSIRAAARGETYLSSSISPSVVSACPASGDTTRTSLERLTRRQREVLQLIAEGHTSKEIAQELGISLRTAEEYRSDVMKALGIHDVAGLTRYAIRAGLVSLDT